MMAYCTIPLAFITYQERSVSTKVKFTVTEWPSPHLFPYIGFGTERSVRYSRCAFNLEVTHLATEISVMEIDL